MSEWEKRPRTTTTFHWHIRQILYRYCFALLGSECIIPFRSEVSWRPMCLRKASVYKYLVTMYHRIDVVLEDMPVMYAC